MELMKELSLAPGVSSCEEEVAKIITRELKDVADNIETDSMGNLIATKKGEKKAPKVMLAAHMDEIGLMVRYIDDNGYLKFSTIGGINDQMLMNQTVTVHSSVGENVIGVIGSKPPHVTTPEERKKVVKADDMFIDIGAKDKEEAEKMVKVGDVMTFNSLFVEYPNNLIMGKALDNRVGCYVMIEVLKRVDTRATVYGVGTVQEEVGLKGAKTASFIADASGRGILTQKSVKDMLIKAGDENDIPYQLEVSDGGTTDGTAIHLTREGIPTGVLSVPTRYIHTPVSVCSMEDVENTIELIVKAINEL